MDFLLNNKLYCKFVGKFCFKAKVFHIMHKISDYSAPDVKVISVDSGEIICSSLRMTLHYPDEDKPATHQPSDVWNGPYDRYRSGSQIWD